MNFESYERIMLCERDKDVCLRPFKSYSMDFDIEDPIGADRIFMTGETAIFYNWKTEGDYEYLYRRIDDSLTSVEANKARFALDMSADNFDFPKIAHHKIVWWPYYYGGGSVWRAGISAKAENLKIHEGGYLHLLVEIRYVKAGVDKRLVYNEPDLTAVIDECSCSRIVWIKQLCYLHQIILTCSISLLYFFITAHSLDFLEHFFNVVILRINKKHNKQQ